MKIHAHKCLFVFEFPDEILGNFFRSSSLPEVMRYVILNRNPLIEVLADQINQDSNQSVSNLSGEYLLKIILKALDEKSIPWPNEEFSMIENEEWSQKMKIDSTFYVNHAKNEKEMRAYEIGLLKLASNFLRKRIILVPLLETDPIQTIEPSDPTTCTGQYHIAYCNKLWQDNFFLSVYPKKEANESN